MIVDAQKVLEYLFEIQTCVKVYKRPKYVLWDATLVLFHITPILSRSYVLKRIVQPILGGVETLLI